MTRPTKKSVSGTLATAVTRWYQKCDVPERPIAELIPADALATEPPDLPEVTEPEVTEPEVTEPAPTEPEPTEPSEPAQR